MKTLIIDALCGVGFPSEQIALQCELAGLAVRSADGRWSWIRDRLEAAPQQMLEELYSAMREYREKQQSESEFTVFVHPDPDKSWADAFMKGH
jgi:hypothetical protein